MREEEVFLWRVRWVGKWVTTSCLTTEQSIRKEHPEAVKVESSRTLRMVPDTDEERRASMCTPARGLVQADGTAKMWWEAAHKSVAASTTVSANQKEAK